MVQEEIEINTKPTKAGKCVKKKAKNARLEDMKDGERNHYMESTPQEQTTLI